LSRPVSQNRWTHTVTISHVKYNTVIPPVKESVNYITQLKLKHKLQDSNEIKKVVKLSKGSIKYTLCKLYMFSVKS